VHYTKDTKELVLFLDQELISYSYTHIVVHLVVEATPKVLSFQIGSV